MNLIIHPSKTVTQQEFDRLYFFYLGFVFIKLCRYPWKACVFAFRLMPNLLGFHWGVCKVSKLGAMSKRKSCKIDRIVHGKCDCATCHVLCFPFVSVCTRTHCPFIVPKSSETKHHAEFQLAVQFWNIYFLTLRLIYSLCARSCYANHIK